MNRGGKLIPYIALSCGKFHIQQLFAIGNIIIWGGHDLVPSHGSNPWFLEKHSTCLMEKYGSSMQIELLGHYVKCGHLKYYLGLLAWQKLYIHFKSTFYMG